MRDPRSARARRQEPKARTRGRRSRHDEYDIRFVRLLASCWPQFKGQRDTTDDEVLKLLSDGRWQDLRSSLIRYGRRVGLPANVVLSILMTRSIAEHIATHPEQAGPIEADLAALDEETVAQGDYRLRPLDEFITNLRQAHRRHLPTVH